MLTRDYTFDVENRLASAKTGNQTMSFAYDADGQRVMTTRHDGTVVYTPFPDYEVEDPLTGANSVRTTYRLAGQVVAIRKNDGTNNKLYYPLSDHLGNIIAISDVDGNLESGSNTRYFPFGAFETTPPSSNPSISNHGFTGHRHNNTGANDLGLIYMNARYYLPEIGRFISPDSIVPNPSNPQSFNRYSYVLNNPVNMIDPSGHYAQCSATGSDGFYANCDEWMLEAIRILGSEGGLDGARLAEFFWQWFNDPGKMLHIKAYYAQAGMMKTRQFTADTASIFIDMNVVSDFKRGDIALLGHELEHVSQGTWQALSIQGEVLAYQVEYGIREAMNAEQTPNTRGAMGQLEPSRPPYNAHSYPDLAEARSGFLGDPGEPYNVWIEPNLPWGQEMTYQGQEIEKAYHAWQSEVVRSLTVNFTIWHGHWPR